MKKGEEKKNHKWFARIGQSGAYKYFYSQAELAAYKAHQAGSAIKNKLSTAKKRMEVKKKVNDIYKDHEKARHLGTNGYEPAKNSTKIKTEKWEAVKGKLQAIADKEQKKKDIEKKNKDVRADKMFYKDFDGEPVSLSELAKRMRRNRQDRFYAEKKYREGYRDAMTIEGLRGAFVKSPSGLINPDVYRVVKKDHIGTNGYEPAKNSTKIKKSNRDQSSLSTQQEQLERFNTEMMQESERLNREQIQEQQRQQEMIDNNMMNMMLFSKNNRKRLKYKNGSKA